MILWFYEFYDSPGDATFCLSGSSSLQQGSPREAGIAQSGAHGRPAGPVEASRRPPTVHLHPGFLPREGKGWRGRWFMPLSHPCHPCSAHGSPCSGVASDIPSVLVADEGKISTTERPFLHAQQSPGAMQQPYKRSVPPHSRTCREGAP